MKLKLIIADDEHRVCQLIENILPWEEYGIEITGKAYNGIDAFQLIQNEQPDIVITDIRMPGYNGITLIEKSKENYPDTSFIIISGYRDFEYAQSAIKFGAEDYLLKPVSKEELEQIIVKIIEKKKKINQKNRKDDDIQRELSQNRELLKSRLAKEIVDRGCRVKNKELSFFKDNYSVDFSVSYYQVIILQLDHSETDWVIENTSAVNTILHKTETSLSPFISKHSHEFLCSVGNFKLTYILNMNNSAGLSFQELEHLYEFSSQKASEYGNWRITVCPGTVVSDIEKLNISYEDAEFARRERIIQGCGRIIEKNPVPELDEEMQHFNIDELKVRIRSTVDTGDCSGLEELFLTSVLPAELKKRIKNPDTILKLFNTAVEITCGHLSQISADDEVIDYLNDESRIILNSAGSTEQLINRLAVLHSKVLNTVFSSKRIKDYRPIRIAKEYIDIHYAENIDLNIVAKEAGLNPAYFSTLFKKETGINFKEYLLKKRVDTAKELLVSGNDTIHAVSDKVGYKDVRHFSKVFSKAVGITPNMYRKIYG